MPQACPGLEGAHFHLGGEGGSSSVSKPQACHGLEGAHFLLGGRWSYEVLISSQGLMQIGWCTLNCRFNQEGYQPLQDPPSADLLKAQRLLGYIKNVFTTKIDTQCKVYLVEGVLMRFLLSILEGGGSVDEHPLIQQLLDLMWLLMEDYEVNECLKQLMMSLLRAYRFSPIIPDLGFQGRDEREAREESPEERLRRRAYERGCQRLKKRIEVVEELQVQILKLLLNNKDKGTNFALHPVLIFAAAASISLKLYKPSLFQGEASRYIFLNKFRKFLQENASNRGNPTVLCPPEYMVCFLHRLIAAVRFYWEESKRKSSGVLGSEEAYVPPQLFYNGKVDYFDLQRLGGLLSHLKKTLKDDLASKANIIIDPSEIQAMSMDDLDEDEENGTVQRPAGATAMGGALARPSWLSSPTLGRTNRFLSTAAVSLMSPRRPLGTPERMKVRTLSVEQRTEEDIEGSHGNDGLLQGRPPEESDQPIAEKSLLEIVDGIVMMYNLSVHQQLGKHILPISSKYNFKQECFILCISEKQELVKSQKVFTEKLNHLSRRLAWINATIYSKDKMLDIYWLLRVCIRSIEHMDRTGSLFAFTPEFYLNVAMNSYSALKNYFSPSNSMDELPEFYLNVAMNSYSALKNYFSPSNSMDELPGYEETLTQLAALLAKHFADPRIVGTEPCPSILLQKHMADLLSRDKEMAASFLNSVLNQLNWAFSEFIGMIQELLNQVLNRVTAERNLFDRVVNLRLPGLESVDHYPILVAVTGILVRILVDCEMQG
ncbi:UNVERIFIED_CONTAM: hypothetical protein FKN15_074756 [Acipenser sinensis]